MKEIIGDSVKSWWESRNGRVRGREGTDGKQEGLTSLAKRQDERMSDMTDTAGYKMVKEFTLTFDWLMGISILPGILLRSEEVIV